jgi:hypothetical protein
MQRAELPWPQDSVREQPDEGQDVQRFVRKRPQMLATLIVYALCQWKGHLSATLNANCLLELLEVIHGEVASQHLYDEPVELVLCHTST